MNPDPPAAALCPSLDLTVPARDEQLEPVRDQVESFLRFELGERCAVFPLDEVMLAVQEAITNVVRHAYVGVPSPGPLGVSVEVEESQVCLVVRDQGPGYDPALVPDPTAGPTTPGGYGWFLITSLMSEVQYRRGDDRNELHMIKRLESVEA